MEDTLVPRVGEASSRATGALVGDAVKIAKEVSKVPCKATGTASKEAKVVEVGCGTIVAMDQAASGVHGAPSDASDGHGGNVEEVIVPPTSKGKALRRHCSKVTKERR